jgi:hypothetical protein
VSDGDDFWDRNLAADRAYFFRRQVERMLADVPVNLDKPVRVVADPRYRDALHGGVDPIRRRYPRST